MRAVAPAHHKDDTTVAQQLQKRVADLTPQEVIAELSCGHCAKCRQAERFGRGFVHCPAHYPDEDASLLVSPGNVRPTVWNCKVGCDQAVVTTAIKRKLCAPLLHPGLTLAQLAAAKGLPIESLKRHGLREVEHRRKAAVAMPYYDEAGALLFERLRVSLDGKMRFLQPKGEPLAPYGLDGLEAARTLGKLTIVEGESDCWACWAHGEPALGLPGKASWRPEWARHLRGFHVQAWIEPGADDLAEKLLGAVPGIALIRAPADAKDPGELFARHGSRGLVELLRVPDCGPTVGPGGPTLLLRTPTPTHDGVYVKKDPLGTFSLHVSPHLGRRDELLASRARLARLLLADLVELHGCEVKFACSRRWVEERYGVSWRQASNAIAELVGTKLLVRSGELDAPRYARLKPMPLYKLVRAATMTERE